MNLRLHGSRQYSKDDYSSGKRFRFAVIDLDRSESYPQNFVCMLPLHIRLEGEPENAFQKVFGAKSLEQAKTLLAEAFESEDDPEVKAEIERRLKLLEPKPPLQVECSGCGKPFHPGWVRRFRRRFCPECMTKKYGSRN